MLKQLYLKPRLLILDEPTSVLTPQEADEVLGHVREFARSGQCTVLIITHKFREVMAYADDVTVLRRGKAVHHCGWPTPPGLLAASDGGRGGRGRDGRRANSASSPVECPSAGAIKNGATPCHRWRWRLQGDGRPRHAGGAGHQSAVRPGEIVGVAGVSGNGQRELVEALVGQRPRLAARCGHGRALCQPGAKRTAA
jgi:hypothetical protein